MREENEERREKENGGGFSRVKTFLLMAIEGNTNI
jgi:hypothetical protein